MSFDSLGLSQPLLRAVAETGYTSPTPIQAQSIPVVLAGKDLLGGAQTGTGKTASFTLPLLERLMQSTQAIQPSVNSTTGRTKLKRHVRALILTPTRELAAQVEESVRIYGKYSNLRSMVIFGGVGMQPQVERLRQGVDILVATPGRLLDHHQQGTLDLRHVEIFVLDEADRMLDMGFIHDVKKVLALLPQQKQSLLFSATFSDEIKTLADRLLKQPQVIEVARRNQTADTIEQMVYPVSRNKKKDLLAHLILTNNWKQLLVFTRMKHGANKLVDHLLQNGINAAAIHGNKSQSARTKALVDFKKGFIQVLVATDIAARGIDIDQLPLVVNYELPNVPEDYVHRIGRTGRAGSIGRAISLVCVDENIFLRGIEKLIKRDIPQEHLPNFAPLPDEKPEPIVLGRTTIGERSNPSPKGHRSGGRGESRGRAPANKPKTNPRQASTGESHQRAQSREGTASTHSNTRSQTTTGSGSNRMPKRP